MELMKQGKEKAASALTGLKEKMPRLGGVKEKWGALKKPYKWLIIVLLVVALLLLFILPGAGGKKNTAAITYTEEEVITRNISKSLSGSGTLLPANSYTVMTLIEGDVLSADFEEGDIVEKDTVLYQIDSSDAATNIEKSQISLSQAQRSYKNNMDKQYVKAPVAGMVYSLDVKVGDEVTQGQSIGTVLDSSYMYLKVPFPADDTESFYIGQTATVTLDSTFETLSGTVTAVSGADIIGKGNTITRNVTIRVANVGGLTDGQLATAAIGGMNCAGSAKFTYQSKGTLVAETAGTVVSIQKPEGSTVSKNQIVLTLGGEDLADQLQSASESLRSAQLSMENTQDQLDNYTIKSPIGGTIVDKGYKVGDTIESGSQLCTIYDLTYLEMTLNIDELDISNMSVGQSVRITADAVEGKVYEGKVTKVSVAGTTTNGTTSYPVTIQIDETEGLLPGMNVDAEIVISETANVLSVPNSAVARGNMVLVTKNSPSAKNALEQEAPEGYVYVQVETGLSDDDYVEIVSGLTEGDTVAYVKASGTSQSGMMPMGGMPMGGGMPSGGMPSGDRMPSGGGMPGGGGGRQ